jgi:hypothetical protein
MSGKRFRGGRRERSVAAEAGECCRSRGEHLPSNARHDSGQYATDPFRSRTDYE